MVVVALRVIALNELTDNKRKLRAVYDHCTCSSRRFRMRAESDSPSGRLVRLLHLLSTDMAFATRYKLH